jgi:hypothetical protein
MRILVGNVAPLDGNAQPVDLGAPCVTDIVIPDTEVENEDGTTRRIYTLEPGMDINELARHLLANPDITRLPNHSAIVTILHSQSGLWNKHSNQPPAWVWSDEPEMERLLSEFWQCPTGIPEDVEMTHHTMNGPPGVGPGCEANDSEEA